MPSLVANVGILPLLISKRKNTVNFYLTIIKSIKNINFWVERYSERKIVKTFYKERKISEMLKTVTKIQQYEFNKIKNFQTIKYLSETHA